MKLTLQMRPPLEVFALICCLSAILAFASDVPRKRSKADRDISAIGHRTLVQGAERSPGNWYSFAAEQKLGDQYAAQVEHAVPPIVDPAISSYLDGLLQRIAQNSDAKMPVTLRILNRDKVQAFTLPGGHQYISRGLLLLLQNEGELASVLARGVAHTALRSYAREMTQRNLMQLASIPGVTIGPGNSTGEPLYTSGPANHLALLKFQRLDEFDADYFGIQYLYKAGYDTDCFLSAIQSIASANSAKPTSVLFEPFPPVPDRLDTLHKEIGEILPKQAGAVVSSPAFKDFQDRLRSLKPPPEPDERPKLVRPDSPPTP